MPDERVDFLDGVLNLIICISWLNSQLENQPVEFVYDESDLDALLESVSDDLFCVYHDLGRTRNPTISARKRGG